MAGFVIDGGRAIVEEVALGGATLGGAVDVPIAGGGGL